MHTGISRGTPLFDEPAIYHISVEGQIPAAWNDRLDGMQVSVVPAAPSGCVSTLTGTLNDQTALAGVLNTLYSLHLVVLTVTRIETPSGGWG